MATEKRLIYADSGQESVEYLKRHLIVGDSDFLRGFLQGAEALADGLAKFPPVDAVEVVRGQWIPVTERLPEECDRYLCNVKSFAFPGSFYQAILHYDKYGFREGNIYTDDVTHWMPLPEPPETAG